MFHREYAECAVQNRSCYHTDTHHRKLFPLMYNGKSEHHSHPDHKHHSQHPLNSKTKGSNIENHFTHSCQNKKQGEHREQDIQPPKYSAAFFSFSGKCICAQKENQIQRSSLAQLKESTSGIFRIGKVLRPYPRKGGKQILPLQPYKQQVNGTHDQHGRSDGCIGHDPNSAGRFPE